MHDRLYHVSDVEKVVKRAGFKIERLECLTHYGLPFNHYLTNLGYRMRTSTYMPENIKKTMTKFSKQPKITWFTRILDFINMLDRRNNRHFSPKTSTVGIYIRAKKT
jgi:hypothetical protein